MNRISQVQSFIEHDLKNNFIIEPTLRYESVKERLSDIINTYKPGVIVKAGIGHGDLLIEISKLSKAYTVVVEPSMPAIQNFMDKHGKDEELQKLRFINGDFQDLPVDYYAADLFICIDYLDFFDSSKCINEFKRALQFEGILFLATVILNDNDIEGVYDDFLKLIFPLHNDYYIEEDINTFMQLKEFSLVKNMKLKFANNLQSKIDYFSGIYGREKDAGFAFIKSHNKEFIDFLNMNEKHDISEPYYIGVYMKTKSANV